MLIVFLKSIVFSLFLKVSTLFAAAKLPVNSSFHILETRAQDLKTVQVVLNGGSFEEASDKVGRDASHNSI